MKALRGFLRKNKYNSFMLAILFILILVGLVSLLHHSNKQMNFANNSSTTHTPSSYPYFVPGKTTFVKSISVGPNGGILKIENTGTPADGVIINVHKGALTQEVKLSVSYNDGKMYDLQEGKFSGKTLVLFTTPHVDFAVAQDDEGVQITVPFNNSPKPKVIAPYEIDDKNRLQPLQLEAIDEQHYQARFATFHPLMFTWIYVY